MKKLGAELKRHALTAISYMLPLVVASGLLIAIGNLMGGENVTELSKMTLPSALTTLGVMGMGLLPSFIAGYIAYSIADRPGIAPGFLMGQIASFLGAGFCHRHVLQQHRQRAAHHGQRSKSGARGPLHRRPC